MAVRVAKIDAAAAVPVIELTVAEAPRCAAIGELRLANAAEDGIELGIADVEERRWPPSCRWCVEENI